MLEPQRQNRFTHSEFLEGFTKASSGTASNPIVTSNYAISPEGVQNATRVQFNAGGGGTSSDISRIYNSFTLFGGTQTMSVYLKSADGASHTITLIMTNSNVKEVEVTNEWQRFDATQVNTSPDNYGIGLYGDNAETADILVYGFQLETGSYPTSYIPTYGTSVTRSAEEYCKVNNIEDIPNEYTLFFEIEDIQASQNNSVIMDLYSTTANTISVRTYETSGDGRLRFIDIVNGSTLFYLEHTSRKYCIRVNGTSVDGFTNGTLISSATAGSSMNNLDDLNIRGGSSQRSLTKYKQIVAFPTALTDSECIALTTL